jgi:hypothetical protein
VSREPGDLGQILADAREEAKIIERMGNAPQAKYLLQLLDKISEATEDYRLWLSEDKAQLKSGLSVRTLRRRFRELYDCGLARYNLKHQREYRSVAIPSRPDVQQAKADAWAA